MARAWVRALRDITADSWHAKDIVRQKVTDRDEFGGGQPS
jgi:hypothetical protein